MPGRTRDGDAAGMNTTYPCPACRAPADLDAGCSGCHRPPDPEAAEVIALDARYAAHAREVGAAWQAYLSGAADLEELRQRRNRLAARVAARAFATRSPVAPPLAPAAPDRPYAPAP